MAKILGKDQATYSREHDGFLRDLQHFHETRGTPFRRAPMLGGKEIDLYLLYTLVTAQGGWIKVNAKNTWSELLPCFQIPNTCVNGSVALKQIYLRHLDRWEKVHYLGEEADRGSDDDEESRHKRWSARSLHSVPCTYNYSQHNIAETNREYNHLSIDLYKPSDYDRLALSLISPLPNEQDFAINVCTLLSNDGKHTLKLEKHPRIINYLLGHAGVFSHSSLRKLFFHYYNDIRKKSIKHFWYDVIESKEFLDLTNEAKFSNKLNETKTEPAAAAAASNQEKRTNLIKDDEVMDVDLNESIVQLENCTNNSESVEIVSCNDNVNNLDTDSIDDELFFIKRSLGTQDYIGQRVLQIATILRNLSFIDENITILVQNHTYVRFILLCASSRWGTLKNLGLDMLGNIASEFIVKDIQNDQIAIALMKIVTNGLQSNDRAACISSLEVLNKLSQNEENEDTMLRSLEQNVYEKVCSFLTIHDVMLLIYTLECLYSLSSLGERSCNLIISNHGVIDTLVSLVTVEGKSYGPKACIGMKLVETLPSGSVNQAQQQQQQQQQNSTTTTSTAVSSTVTTTATATPVVSTLQASKAITPSTPVRAVQVTAQRLIAITPTPVTPTSSTSSSSSTNATTTSNTSITTTSQTLTPQQIIQQHHAHQQTVHENEQFALAWLRATYEPCTNSKIDHQELYKHYISSCTRIGRRGVISPLHFPRCVRSVFGGTVGPNPMKPSNPNEPQYYEGIKVRSQPLVINIQQQPNTTTIQITTLNTTSATTTAIAPTTPAATATIIGKQNNRRKIITSTAATQIVTPVKSPVLTVVAGSSSNNTNSVVAAAVVTMANSSADSDSASTIVTVSSPASPILKAQLSAPPKQSVVVGQPTAITSKGDIKSQAMAHPHLSQALLGTPSASTSNSNKDSNSTLITQQSGQSSTSLIKSLLATKVNDCMTTTVSMKTATDCQNVAQVAARLLAQQSAQTPDNQKTGQKLNETPKSSRVNGVRQLFTDSETTSDSSVSSTTQCTTTLTKGKKEPPQPPPPPLAPLSNNKQHLIGVKTLRIENEDSDSIGNNSLSSSTGLGTVGLGGISSTEDGDNSLTSFEGLLNGVPNIDNPLNEDSNSKDSVKLVNNSEITVNKPLRLADLLEKKFEKSSPSLLNGVLGKDKTIDLVENHIEKALNSRDNDNNTNNSNNQSTMNETSDINVREVNNSLKRPSSDEITEASEPKKLLLSGSSSSTSNVNGGESPAPPDSVTSSNGEESSPATVSTAAAKLFADIAADILEDEDEEQLMQEAVTESPSQPVVVPPAAAAAAAATTTTTATTTITTQQALPQIIMENNQPVLLTTTQPRQIIVSQSHAIQSGNQVVISTGAKTAQGQTVIVQNPTQQRTTPVVLQQNAGQFLLSQGQVQFVTTSQPGHQYVIQTSSGQNTYMVAQPQTAVVHGQPQTVLVAQTSQQQGTGAKTIIILQQQPANSAATHHQKVVVTPQGQQVVVTQVPRPILHTSSLSNNVITTKTIKTVAAIASTGTGTSVTAVATTTTTTAAAAVAASSNSATTTITTTSSSTTTTSQNGVAVEVKEEKITPAKPKIIRDLSTPFVCEWGDCNVGTKFKSANEVYLHVCECHCPTGSEEITCQWDRCDNMKRKRFSLMTHLHDKHCNTEAMKQSLVRRKQNVQSGKVEAPPTTSSTPHPGYAPDAALHAIKRHALEFVNPKELQQKGGTKQSGTPVVSAASVVTPRAGPSAPVEQDDNEGPVTKSIRLTASLILRNLVIYSAHCRRYLKHYEPHLANVALSNVESSRTIAQVLYDMNESSNLR